MLRFHRPFIALLAAAAGLLSIATRTTAQTTASSAEVDSTESLLLPVQVLSEFEVIGSKERVLSLSGSGFYLERAQIGDLQYNDINRVLRQVPGVYIREEDGYGNFPNLSLRGVDTTRSGKITVMEDGVVTAPATYSAPSAYYTPTTGRMSGIEVLKGSSQIRSGPHTTGGAINYLSTPIPAEVGGRLRAAYGSNEEILLHATYGGRRDTALGTVGFLAEVFHNQTDGFKSIDPAGRYSGSDKTGFMRSDYMFKVSFEPKSDRYQYFEFKIGTTEFDADETYLGLTTQDLRENPGLRYAASREDNIASRQTRLYLRHAIDLTASLRLTTTGYYSKFHRNWFKLHDIRDIDTDGDGLPEGMEPGGKAVASSLSAALAGSAAGAALELLKGERSGNLRVRANNRGYYLGGIETALGASFNTGSLKHELALGLRYHNDRIRRFQWHELYHQNASGDFISSQRSPNGSDGNRRQETKATAFYAHDEVRAGALTFTPGLRYESLDYTYTDFSRDGENIPTGSGGSELKVWAPGVGVTYQPSEYWNFFGSIHRGFSVPGPRAHARSGIVEETSDAFEAGVRFNTGAGFFGEFIYFHTDFDDLILIDNIGGAGSGSTENVGQVRSQGIEFLLGFDAFRSSSSDFRAPVTVALTYTDAVLEGDARSGDPESIFSGGKNGNRVPYIPEFQVNITAGLEMGAFRTYLSASYADETYSSASNVSAEVNPVTMSGDARFGKTDSYFIVDVSAYLEVGNNWELFGTVRNLFDDRYLSSRHPHGPRTGAPRLATVGVALKF